MKIKTKEEMLEYLKGKRFDISIFPLVNATMESTKKYAQEIINAANVRYLTNRKSIKSVEKYKEFLKLVIQSMVEMSSLIMAKCIGLDEEQVDLSSIVVEISFKDDEEYFTAKLAFPFWATVYKDLSLVVGEAETVKTVEGAEKMVIDRPKSYQDKYVNKTYELASEALTEPDELFTEEVFTPDEDDKLEGSVLTVGNRTIN